ncbi:MAG: T9SS type A sorting domain-containing protein [Flavobacteriaceae bacterium]
MKKNYVFLMVAFFFATAFTANAQDYEAEDATLSGAVTTNCTKASGGTIVKDIKDGNSVTFSNVEVTDAGSYDVVLTYTAKADRTITVQINGGTPQDVAFVTSGDFCYQTGTKDYTLTTPLNAGTNIVVVSNSTSGQFFLDKISVATSTLSIDNIEQQTGLNMVVFPSSVSKGQDVTVRLSNTAGNGASQVVVFDVIGRVVVKPFESTLSTVKIPTSTLSNSGIYLVKVTVGNKSMVKRLVVK